MEDWDFSLAVSEIRVQYKDLHWFIRSRLTYYPRAPSTPFDLIFLIVLPLLVMNKITAHSSP
jgi:hypothetical protein